jgi:hypothetical protein
VEQFDIFVTQSMTNTVTTGMQFLVYTGNPMEKENSRHKQLLDHR